MLKRGIQSFQFAVVVVASLTSTAFAQDGNETATADVATQPRNQPNVIFILADDQRELLFGNVAQKENQYAPDLIQEQALKFIRDNKDKPFFCYYAAVQPHADMVAPEKYMKRFQGKFDPETPLTKNYYRSQATPRAAFAGMVTVLDDYVGELMAELKKQGIADNTLVIFTSDNGPHVEGGHDPEYFDSNGVYKGTKRDLYEGGPLSGGAESWFDGRVI